MGKIHKFLEYKELKTTNTSLYQTTILVFAMVEANSMVLYLAKDQTILLFLYQTIPMPFFSPKIICAYAHI